MKERRTTTHRAAGIGTERFKCRVCFRTYTTWNGELERRGNEHLRIAAESCPACRFVRRFWICHLWTKQNKED